MEILKDMTKIKEYDNFILYKHNKTGIRECFMKIDLFPAKNPDKKYSAKWESIRRQYV